MKTYKFIIGFLIGATLGGMILNTWQIGQIREIEQRVEILREAIEMLEDEVYTEPEPQLQTWVGEASYYSHAGCEGCGANQVMSNGEVFDENAMTIAFNYLPLGSQVLVRNLKTNSQVIAKVTDTGGFNAEGRRLNLLAGVIIENDLERVADLSVGVKEAIGCGGLCEVIIEVVK